MASWGSNNDSASFPTFVNGMKGAGYSNAYGNTTTNGTWGVTANQASGHGAYATGWVYLKRGTGPAVGYTISAGGTGYSNTDTWTIGGSGSTANANGVLVTNATGGVVGATFNSKGNGFTVVGGAAVITTSGGDGNAVLTINFGGRAGRKQYETLVAEAVLTSGANSYTGF